ncbi:hypothetical protein BH18THE2_BH18THE2_35960 [soil metagenome]
MCIDSEEKIRKQWILVKKYSDDDELLINKELRKGKNSSNR